MIFNVCIITGRVWLQKFKLGRSWFLYIFIEIRRSYSGHQYDSSATPRKEATGFYGTVFISIVKNAFLTYGCAVTYSFDYD
jgi:hypothetical protein